MVPFPQNWVNKDSGKPLPPGFWIGLILVTALICIVNMCKGGVIP